MTGAIRQSCRVGLLLGLLIAAGCDSKPENGPVPAGTPGVPAPAQPASTRALLTDVTAEAGIDFVHDKHDTGNWRFPEINGAGVGVLDYDNDGWYDLYFVQSAKLPMVEGEGGRVLSDQLYRNRGDGTFENVTEQAGIHETKFGMGVVCGDIDNDGFVDIYVYNTGPDTLYRNNGDGTFTDITAAAGLGDPRWGDGAAFLDYDEDGWLDLFVCNYVAWSPVNERECTISGIARRDYCGPVTHAPEPDVLYRNNGTPGDPSFTDVSEEVGIARLTGSGMGVGVADFNGDGLQDIYVGNDARPNRMLIQQPDHTFKDLANQMLVDVNSEGMAQSSMGITIEDFNLDGQYDLLLGHFWDDPNTLYINHNGSFIDASRTARLHLATLRVTTFGISVLNLHNDHRMQIYLGNGKANVASKTEYKEGNPYGERDQLLEWSFDEQRFTDITDLAGPAFDAELCTRGTAIIDYDNDGDMDVVVCANNGRARLLRAETPPENHWLMVRAIGPDGKRDAYGADIEVEVAGHKPRRRPVYVAYSYCSSSDPRIHFGLGPATHAERVTVYWLDGTKSTWRNVPADQHFVARYNDQSARSD